MNSRSHEDGEMTAPRRLFASVVIVAVIAGLLIPLSWERGRDSFPLSPFPMFSRALKDASLSIDYAVAVSPSGAEEFIPPSLVANFEVLQARATLANAVRRGPKAATALCESIAKRVAEDDDFADAFEVRIVHADMDAVAYLRGEGEGRRRPVALCKVPR
jgi:hypothetical protein